MTVAQWQDEEQKLGADMRIMEHKTMTLHCDTEKCKRSGNDKEKSGSISNRRNQSCSLRS